VPIEDRTRRNPVWLSVSAGRLPAVVDREMYRSKTGQCGVGPRAAGCVSCSRLKRCVSAAGRSTSWERPEELRRG